MRKLFILLIATPYLLTAQVKNPATPKNQTPNSRFANTQANSNKIASTDFEYDAVGNVIKDLTQGISNISYASFSRMERDPYVGGMTSTSFHLPRIITFLDGRKIKNQYDASGKKLVTQLLINDVISVEYSYLGNLTYIRTPGKDWKLIEMKIDEGRLVPKSENSTEMVYEYDIEDQTGSPRVSFRENTTTGQAEIVRKQDYDPFGLPLKGIDYQSPSIDTLSKKYFFNGKEYLVTFGLKMYDYGFRTYNPRLGRYYQIDPKASWMPSWSPYSFSFDNPIRYRDYDGQVPYPITIRSFHPSSGFGGTYLGPGLGRNFSGDNRSFSNSSATARVSHTVTADPEKGTLSYSNRNTFSNPSHHPYFGEGTETPKGYANKTSSGNNSISFETGYSGTNPLAVGPTPDIDNKSFFNITQANGKLSVNANIYGDNFPNTEISIKDPSGQSLFAGVDVRAGGQDSNPLILIGGATENIMNINFSINIDSKGNFTGVVQGNTTYSISDWNDRFRNTNPNPQK
jgi:RHS repeat-associated protein